MRKKLTYEEVEAIYAEASDNETRSRLGLLLDVVNDHSKTQYIKKERFVFTQYEEGHILMTDIKKPR
jgi:hypothetical protein